MANVVYVSSDDPVFTEMNVEHVMFELLHWYSWSFPLIHFVFLLNVF